MQKLSTDEIGKSYKGRQVVRGVSIEVSRGEVVGLLGPNGAGKTTSFYMIVGLSLLIPATVLRTTRHHPGADVSAGAALRISYLPQEPSVFRKLTVEENILAVLEVRAFQGRCAVRARKSLSSNLISAMFAAPGVRAFRRGTSTRGNRALPLHRAVVYPAG